MTHPLRIVIPGRPVPLERHRHNGKASYLPARSRAWRKTAQLYMRQAMRGRKPLSGALAVTITAFLKRPKTGPNRTSKYPIGKGKPDRSNLEKAAEDAGNGLVWEDDSQIVDGPARKRWADDGKGERVEIEVYELEE